MIYSPRAQRGVKSRSFTGLLPWVPETFLARFPVSVKP